MTRTVFLFIFCFSLLWGGLTSPVVAHQPFCEFADLTADAPWPVPDARISYAYFGNVYPAGDVDFFRFEAEMGQSVLISLSIPAIEDIEVYTPVLALFGPGIATDAAPALPAGVNLPAGSGAMLVDLGEEPVYWFEPFGRKYYWNWEDRFFVAPESAAYTVALWHPRDEIGRYSFVIGQREVFGGQADCFATYDAYWTPLAPGQNPYRDTVIPGGAMTQDHSRMFPLPAEGAPTVALQLFPLDADGYFLRLKTRNFTFRPQAVGKAPAPREGHAHLYLDGEKIATVLGEWLYLKSLPEDAEQLSVQLYANDHSAFTVDGNLISDAVTIAEARHES